MLNDAVKFGTVIYDWSNAEEVSGPKGTMNSEEQGLYAVWKVLLLSSGRSHAR